MISDVLKEAITLKLSLARTAPKKFYALKRRTGADGRNHGSLSYHSASTGRWGSQGIQLHNLMRPTIHPVDQIISVLLDKIINDKHELMEMLFGDTVEALACCIRGTLTASEGNRLLVADYSSVEARGIAWLAGEHAALNVFRTHGKIYEHAASQIFKMPIEDIKKGSDERFAGKTTILACGYQGGHNALQKMARDNNVELETKFCAGVVSKWRKANPKITAYWPALERTAIAAIRNPGRISCVTHHLDDPTDVPAIYYVVKHGTLFCKLPSGRLLAYNRPSLQVKTVRFFTIEGEYPINVVYNRSTHGSPASFERLADRHGATIKDFETPTIRFWGVDSVTHKWARQHTYGGSLAENVTQAVARDLLASAMLRLRAAGYPIVLHVHDEVVSERPVGEGSLEEMCSIMAEVPEWAEGFPIEAEGYESFRYKK